MNLDPTGPTPSDVFAERVLDLTRAAAYGADLTGAVDLLANSTKNHLHDLDDNLVATLDLLQGRATDQWLKGRTMSGYEYETRRSAAINRLGAIERRATDIAASAAGLAALLETCEHYDAPEDIAAAIDALRYPDPIPSPDEHEVQLTMLWQRLTPSVLVQGDDLEALRRHFDAVLPHQQFGPLHDAVTAWRQHHLGRARWDAATYEYAITTARDWDELADLWQLLGNPEQRVLTGPENVRARTAIALKVADAGLEAPVTQALREAVNEFNGSVSALMVRLRMAETMADLRAVSEVLTGRARDADGTLRLMVTHNRKYDRLTATAPDAEDIDTIRYSDHERLRDRVHQWRSDIYVAARDCTTPSQRMHYTPEQRYELLYTALTSARDGGADHWTADLLKVTESALAEQLLAPDHAERLRTIVGPGERMVEVDEPTKRQAV